MAFVEGESSFAATFPETVKIGTIFHVVGKFKPGALKFDLNLVCLPSKDRALHCSFHVDEKIVVRNSHIFNVGWQEDEKYGGWPIKESGEFEIELEVEEDDWKISVDGKLFVYFKHRMVYSKITHVNGLVGADYKSINF